MNSFLMQAEEFAQKTFDAVTTDCDAYFFAYGEAGAPYAIRRTVWQREKYEVPGMESPASLVASKKIWSPNQAMLARVA